MNGNTLILLVVSLMYVIRLFRALYLRQIGMWTGYLFGVIYFSLLPLWALYLRGGFSAPPKSRLPAVSWTGDSSLIFTMLTLLVINFFASYFFELMTTKKEVVRPQIQNRNRKNQAVERPVKRKDIEIWHWMLLYCGIAIVQFILLGLGTSGSHWANSSHEYSSKFGATATLLFSLREFLRLTILFSVGMYFWRVATIELKRLLWLIAFAVIELYVTGNRIFLLQILVCLSVILVVIGRVRWLAFLGVFSVPFGYAMILFSAVRTQMHTWKEYSIFGAIDALDRGITLSRRFYKHISIADILSGISEAGSVNVMKAVYHWYPSHEGFLYGATLIRPLVFWIPRSFWPGKPLSFQSAIGVNFVGEGVSLNATVLGECYANAGLVGGLLPSVMLAAYGLLFRTVSAKLPKVPPGLESITFLILGFCLVRNGWVVTLIVFLPAYVFLHYCNIGESSPAQRKVKRRMQLRPQ